MSQIFLTYMLQRSAMNLNVNYESVIMKSNPAGSFIVYYLSKNVKHFYQILLNLNILNW